MKKQLLLTALFLSSCVIAKESEQVKKDLTSQDLIEHGQKWAKQVVSKLNKEELQLLANYLYFNFLATRYDYLIRTSFIMCQNQITSMQFSINSREQEAKKNGDTLIKQVQFLKDEAMPLRTYATKASQACFEHIEDSDLTALKKVIVNLQQYSSTAVNQFIQQDWPKAITKLFSTCAQNMKKESEKLIACQNDLEIKGNMDAEAIDSTDKFGDNFQQAISSADLSYVSYLTLISHTLNVKSMSADILNISALINNIFYNSLLEQLKSTKKMGSCYIMFDENGFIEEEDQEEILTILDEKFAVHKKHLSTTQG